MNISSIVKELWKVKLLLWCSDRLRQVCNHSVSSDDFYDVWTFHAESNWLLFWGCMLLIVSSMTGCMLSTAAFIAVFTNPDIMTSNAVIWSGKNRLRLVMFADEWNVWLFKDDMFNLDFVLDISVVENEKTAGTCSFDEIERLKEKKDFWSDSNLSWNNELLKLCCNFTLDFDSIDLRNLLIIWIRKFSKNHVWKTRKFRLFSSIRRSNWCRLITAQFKLTWWIIQSDENKYFIDSTESEIRELTFLCLSDDKLLVFDDSSDDWIFLVMKEIITRVWFCNLFCQRVVLFILYAQKW